MLSAFYLDCGCDGSALVGLQDGVGAGEPPPPGLRAALQASTNRSPGPITPKTPTRLAGPNFSPAQSNYLMYCFGDENGCPDPSIAGVHNRGLWSTCRSAGLGETRGFSQLLTGEVRRGERPRVSPSPALRQVRVGSQATTNAYGRVRGLWKALLSARRSRPRIIEPLNSISREFVPSPPELRNIRKTLFQLTRCLLPISVSAARSSFEATQ